jgi:hypothetical protein
MDNFIDEYNRIKLSSNVRKELAEKSAEFREEYRAQKKRDYNDAYRAVKLTEINERRRNKYKTVKNICKEIVSEEKVEELPTVIPAVSENICPIYEKIHKYYIKFNPEMKEPVEKVKYLMDFINKQRYYTFYIYKYHSYLENHVDDIYNENPDDLMMFYNIFAKFTGKLSVVAYKMREKLLQEKLIEEHKDPYKNCLEDIDINFDYDILVDNYFNKVNKNEFKHSVLYMLMFIHSPKYTPAMISKGVKYENLDLSSLPPKIAEDFEKCKNYEYIWYPSSLNRISNEFKKIMNDVYKYPFGIIDVRKKYNRYMLFNTSSS